MLWFQGFRRSTEISQLPSQLSQCLFLPKWWDGWNRRLAEAECTASLLSRCIGLRGGFVYSHFPFSLSQVQRKCIDCNTRITTNQEKEDESLPLPFGSVLSVEHYIIVRACSFTGIQSIQSDTQR